MKNLKKIILILTVLTHNLFHAVSASQEALIAANSLIKVSYTSPEMQYDVISFINHDTIVNRANADFIIPSTDEIVKKVSQLQNFQGYIENKTIREQAIKALKTAMRATKNAISITKLQTIHINEDDYHIPSTKNSILLEVLKNKKDILQQKIDQLDQKSIWSYFAKPSTAYLIFGAAIILAITGTAYYFHFNQSDPYNPLLYQTTPRQGETQLSTETRKILTDFVDPHNESDGEIHYNNAKELLQKLQNSQDSTINSIETVKVIEMINTFIEGYERKNVTVFGGTPEQKSNREFWVSVYFDKNDEFTKTISTITGIEPKNIKLANAVYYKVGVNVKP